MYLLRARVIEGSIPMPDMGSDPTFKGLDFNNFEIFAPYTKDNFKKLYDIGKKAWEADKLSKYEILAWAGGANNHTGDRFLWMFRPDQYNFERIPVYIYKDFDRVKPQALSPYMQQYYNRLWKPLKHGFSLSAYESHVPQKERLSLNETISQAKEKTRQQSQFIQKGEKSISFERT